MTNLGAMKVAFSYKGNERKKTFVTIKNSAGEVLVKTSVKRAVDDVNDKLLGRFFGFKKAMNQLAIENLATKQQRAEAWRLFSGSVKLPKEVNLSRERRMKALPAVILL
jgi:hypothetical protein